MQSIDTSSAHAFRSTVPAIGLVIPTYNRAAELLQVLARLEAQTVQDFEVVVVDDGSTDRTRPEIELYQRSSIFPLRYLNQPNSGPARARNLGVSHLHAPLCILLGDDIYPAPRFVESHLTFHQVQPALEAVAVGLTRWSEDRQTVTPFMRWLDRDGVQFAYGDLRNGVAPSWKHFYTSNLSLKTDYLRLNPFHEAFLTAAMEDIELGYRLAKTQNLQMYFLPEAEAHHVHPTTFLRACHRMHGVGEAAFLFGRLWPEHRSHPPRRLHKRILLALLEGGPALSAMTWFTDAVTRFWCPNPLLSPTLLLHQRKGYGEAEARNDRISAKAGIDPDP